MKIIIDSNVIISAFATRGFCHELFEICLSDHEIYLSRYILSECEKKFKIKIKLPARMVKDIIKYLKSETNIVIPEKIEVICRDKKDIPIIGTAVAANADIIVTGDNDLLDLIKYKKIKILSPRKFWEYLKK